MADSYFSKRKGETLTQPLQPTEPGNIRAPLITPEFASSSGVYKQRGDRRASMSEPPTQTDPTPFTRTRE